MGIICRSIEKNLFFLIPIQVLPDYGAFQSIELWHSLSRITEFSIQVRDVNSELNGFTVYKNPSRDWQRGRITLFTYGAEPMRVFTRLSGLLPSLENSDQSCDLRLEMWLLPPRFNLRFMTENVDFHCIHDRSLADIFEVTGRLYSSFRSSL